jgi:hypothetical protein
MADIFALKYNSTRKRHRQSGKTILRAGHKIRIRPWL